MYQVRLLALWLRGALDRVRESDADRDGNLDGDHAGDRGDVPGWVMVTVMSAILVVAILAVFEPEIKAAITGAIDAVTNSK